MPLEICSERDTKGLYEKAYLNIIKDFTGVTSPFEKSKNSEIILQGEKNINTNLNIILEYLEKNKIFNK